MNKFDKYYTNKNVVKLCCKLFKKIVKSTNKDLIIEPSAGNGAFITCLKKYKNTLFLDIKPEHKNIIKQNFLKFKYKNIIKKYNNIHLIGNPPFGKKSSTAIKFIKYACKFCNTFSFILPKSFDKYFMKKTIPLNFHLIKSINLPENSFNLPIKCIFQIWKKKKYSRKIIKKIKTNNNYVFVKKNENPTFAIRRVGSKSGYIYYNSLENKNINTHYFVKILKKNKFNLSKINFKEKNYTLGPNSISKMDIIIKLNKILL
jgi:predicted RNA methylase